MENPPERYGSDVDQRIKVLNTRDGTHSLGKFQMLTSFYEMTAPAVTVASW